MNKIKRKDVKVGDIIKLNDIGNENKNYKEWIGKPLTVVDVYYNESEHLGYDMSLYPMVLVECADFPFAIYRCEFRIIKRENGMI